MIKSNIVKNLAVVLQGLSVQFWFAPSVFFTFVLVPVIFSKYGGAAAGAILTNLFPVFGIYLLVVISISLFSSIVLWQKSAIVLGGVSLLVVILQAFYFFPAIEQLRQNMLVDPTVRAAFRSMHGQSQVLNLVMLICGAIWTALRSRTEIQWVNK